MGNCTLCTLNISGPSIERAERLTGYLLGLDADVLVLTEARSNEGTELLIANLVDAGYGYEACWPRPSSRERGVAVLSRASSLSGFEPVESVDLSHRLIVGDIGIFEPAQLVAAYVPSRDASKPKIERKRRFLDQMVKEVEQAARPGPVILVGDLNIVSRTHQPRYAAFRAWEYEVFDRLTEIGLVDVFAELHPGVQAHSWIGRTGNGYRYDYVFVSKDLVGAVHECTYMQTPRENGLSDHAAVMLEFREHRKR